MSTDQSESDSGFGSECQPMMSGSQTSGDQRTSHLDGENCGGTSKIVDDAERGKVTTQECHEVKRFTIPEIETVSNKAANEGHQEKVEN